MSPILQQPCSLSREAAVDVARAWRGTPYVLGARVQRCGCDCATLLIAYLIAIGVASEQDFAELGAYSHDWFCNTSSERYMLHLLRFAKKKFEGICRPNVAAQPGDLVLFRVARSNIFNHGAIVTNWPKGIHAVHPKVEEVDLAAHWMTGHTEMEVFDLWGNS